MTTAVYRTADAINSAMLRVYNHMALAIATSGIVSLAVSSSPELMKFLFTGVMQWIVVFAPLAFVILLGFKMRSMSPSTARIMLYAFAAVMGLSFSTIFIVYNLGSIVSAFMGAAILFATMSGYGYFTKRSLESLGQFMFIGLVAILIASIINNDQIRERFSNMPIMYIKNTEDTVKEFIKLYEIKQFSLKEFINSEEEKTKSLSNFMTPSESWPSTILK